MNPYRYVPVGNDVYVDQWGTPPTRPGRLAAVVVTCMVGCVVFSGGGWLFTTVRANQDRSACASHIKAVSLALVMYAQDNDATLPPVDAAFLMRDEQDNAFGPAHFGWAGAIAPYMHRDGDQYHCPAAPHPQNGHNETSNNFTDYWFNDNLATRRLADIQNSSELLMVGDGNDGVEVTDPGYSLGALPSAWINDPSKPPYRHQGGANYAFADGHVQWLQPDELPPSPAWTYTLEVATKPVPHQKPPHPTVHRVVQGQPRT